VSRSLVIGGAIALIMVVASFSGGGGGHGRYDSEISSEDATEEHQDAPAEVDPVELASDHGMPCTVDCSGHAAGYQWAETQGITDHDDCGGNSESFIEGCRTRAEEAAEQEHEEEDAHGSAYGSRREEE
jgi:hypothetical protein